jgi:alanine dehydrogenase
MALVSLPNSIAIIGGGVIAVEYATVFSQLGVGVSLICSDSEFLPFLEVNMYSHICIYIYMYVYVYIYINSYMYMYMYIYDHPNPGQIYVYKYIE